VHLQIRRREVFAGARGSFEGDAYVFVDDVDALFEEPDTLGSRTCDALAYDDAPCSPRRPE